MKRLLFAVLLTLLLANSVSAQEQFVVFGFSFFTSPEVVGTTTTLLAVLEPEVGFTYPLPIDTDANQYTFVWESTITSIIPGAFTTEYSYADASFFIYEDPAKNGDYGITPPNGTAPSTFQDGNLILTGTMSNVSRVDVVFSFPEPTVVADIVFTGGSRLGELPAGGLWTYHGGLSTNPLLGIPSGYQRNWATKIVLLETLPVQDSTWGKIKNLFW